MISRRSLLSGGAAALSGALSPWLLGGCTPKGGTTGLVAIQWDREPCTQCGMALSDRRFAVQVQGGPGNQHHNFDDIGCAITWLAARQWPTEPAPRLWVAALDSRGEPRWLDAAAAGYLEGHASPMGYGFGAVDHAEPGSIGFPQLRERVLARTRRTS